MFYCSQIGGLDLPLARLLLGKSPSTQRNLSRRYVLSVAAVTVSGIAYSLLVYKVFDLRNILRTYTGTSSAGSFGTIFFWLLLNASISEELLFRLCIQNFLASKFRLMRNRYWIAVVLTAGLWSLFHMGVPFLAWAKFLQVFPFGVALGFLFRKYGLEACILTHAGFNVGLNTIALYFSLFR
jgi:membrane protease YdiL (CAAX protease family)